MAVLRDKRSNLFAALGAASGLGNAFRFPHLLLQYGRSFFVAYACVLLFACFPLLAAELSYAKRKKLPAALVRAAAANSLIISLYYSTIAARLGGEGLSCVFGMPDICLIIALVLTLAAVYAVLKRKKAAYSGKLSVVCFFALFGALAVLGDGKFKLAKGNLMCCSMWVDAFGQALLSLSLAAAVMPDYACSLPKNFNCVATAAKVIAVNAVGCTLASLATLPFVNLQPRGEGLNFAFEIYPQVIALAKTPMLASLFGLTVYGCLWAVALHSICSLAAPALKARPALFCLSAALLSPLFISFGGEVLSAVDFTCCSVISVTLALAEYVCLTFTLKNRLSRIYMAINALPCALLFAFSLGGVRSGAHPLLASICPVAVVLCAACGLTTPISRCKITVWKIYTTLFRRSTPEDLSQATQRTVKKRQSRRWR